MLLLLKKKQFVTFFTTFYNVKYDIRF